MKDELPNDTEIKVALASEGKNPEYRKNSVIKRCEQRQLTERKSTRPSGDDGMRFRDPKTLFPIPLMCDFLLPANDEWRVHRPLKG